MQRIYASIVYHLRLPEVLNNTISYAVSGRLFKMLLTIYYCLECLTIVTFLFTNEYRPNTILLNRTGSIQGLGDIIAVVAIH